MGSEVEERHCQEKARLESEIAEMLATAKSKNERKRINQQAEKLRRELYDRQEEERIDPLVSLASEICKSTETGAVSLPEPKAEDDTKAQKREKNRQKRMDKEQKQRQQESEIALAANSKTRGEIEYEAMIKQLRALNLRIKEVLSDGHCLYRAVAVVLSYLGFSEYSAVDSFSLIRQRCAEELRANKDHYFAFSECRSNEDWETYCEKVRSSNQWGGEIELLAICAAFRLKLTIHRAGVAPIIRGMGSFEGQLAFLQHFTKSGAHYAAVIEDVKS
jgi:OTU domain-containing protein 6